MENSSSIGSILKQEREQRGLTLESVQEATKIPIDSLKAIEEGYKIRTLTAFYYKSFVRLYALHLGVDPLPILKMIPSYQPAAKAAVSERLKPAPRDKAVKKSVVAPIAKPEALKLRIAAPSLRMPSWPKLVPVAAGIAAVIVLGAGIIWLVGNTAKGRGTAAVAVSSEKVKVSRPVKSDKLTKVAKVEKAEKIEKAEKAERTERIEKVEKTEPVKEVKMARVEPAPPAAAPVVVPAVKPAEPVKDQHSATLTVRAGVTAWLTVKCDGSTVFKGSLKKGSFETWHAVKKIEISGKEVDGLEFEVNGKTIGKLGRHGAKARKVIVTPDGLTVEK
jgi:cytoskeletal protein RodZ